LPLGRQAAAMTGKEDAVGASSQPQADGLPISEPPPTAAVIVVGVDGSETSWDALWWACGEALRLGGRTVAIFVSPSGSSGTAAAAVGGLAGMGAANRAWIEETGTEQAEDLRRQLEHCAVDNAVNLTFVHALGDAATELLRLATAYHADQIVVGRSSKALHHLAGSLGRRLVAKRQAPVVVVVP
jgi:nucleotide-binding universal stress UspA family protein